MSGAEEAQRRPDAKILANPLATGADRLAQGQTSLEWVDVSLVVDDPAKGLGKASRDQLMISRLGSILGDVKKSLDLVSAYFIPGKPGTAYFASLARAGVPVRILTNSLETTDVAMVHAGYSKYRRDLLEAGARLFELKPVVGAPCDKEQLGVTGSSGASLHAKTFAVDGSRIFIGSFNFDPRSALLNCEMGFLIGSPTLARSMSDASDTAFPPASYQPVLNSAGQMTWLETGQDKTTVVHESEPGTTWFGRMAITVLGWLPIEWLL